MNPALAFLSLRSLNRLTALRAVHTSRVVLAPSDNREPPDFNDPEFRERAIKRSQKRAEAMHALATSFQKMETQKPRSREEFRDGLKELESVLVPYVDLYAEKYSGGMGGGDVDDGTQPFREKLGEVRSILAELDKQDRGRG